MRNRILAVTIASLFVLIALGCKQTGKYGELEEYMNDVIKANEEYITSLEKADSGKEVAKAISDLGEKMGKLNERSHEIEKKFPELKSDKMKKDPPDELKDEFQKLEQMAQRLLAASMKMMKYMDDPAVMKASQEMEKMLRKPSATE